LNRGAVSAATTKAFFAPARNPKVAKKKTSKKTPKKTVENFSDQSERKKGLPASGGHLLNTDKRRKIY
jgi:hypothetical protein